MAKKKQKTGKIAGFIVKLIDILKNKENQDIIFYNEQERSFTIKNIRKFTEEILPKYFKHKNYSSFVRQVNLYDFHKIRHQGKQEAYKQDFFDILSPKELKKIKRKPMGSQKVKHTKKQENNSDESENDGGEMQDDYLESQSENRKSSQSQSEYKRQEMNLQLDDLEKKKWFLQTQIRKEQEQNEKLESENTKLKNIFHNQNTQFYNELLKILQSLMISQYNLGDIKRSTYDKIVRQIYQQKQKLIEVEKENQNIYDVLKREGKNQKAKYLKESKFMGLIKELLNVNKEILTIPNFIQTLLIFIENQDTYHTNNNMDAVPDPLFMNYDPYYISNQQHSRDSQRLHSNQEKKQTYDHHRRLDLCKNQSKESESIRMMKERNGHQNFERSKTKKRSKKRDSDSDDQEYVPKSHR